MLDASRISCDLLVWDGIGESERRERQSGLGMFMTGCCPNMEMGGLWFSASVKFFIPSKKNLHLSKPQVEANPSPSIGE